MTILGWLRLADPWITLQQCYPPKLTSYHVLCALQTLQGNKSRNAITIYRFSSYPTLRSKSMCSQTINCCPSFDPQFVQGNLQIVQIHALHITYVCRVRFSHDLCDCEVCLCAGGTNVLILIIMCLLCVCSTTYIPRLISGSE